MADLTFIYTAVSFNLIVLVWIAWAVYRMKKRLKNHEYK